ncbi:MAG: hypothetical protein WDN69_13470 [Aliidongia sp.]
MAAIDLKLLVGRLNDLCRRALEAAAGHTLSRTHYNVEIEHWLLQLLDAAQSDAALLVRHFEIPADRLTAELTVALDRMKTRERRAPSLSPDLVGVAEGSLAARIGRTGCDGNPIGHLLWAMLADETISARLCARGTDCCAGSYPTLSVATSRHFSQTAPKTPGRAVSGRGTAGPDPPAVPLSIAIPSI